MPRAPRIHFPGALWHVIVRSDRPQGMFVEPRDCSAFLHMLSQIKQQRPFHLYAFCLMPQHFHLALEVQNAPLPALMQKLLVRYVKYFNRANQKGGRLLASRYHAILCQKSLFLKELVRYIHLHPIRSKIAKNLKDWPWSSHHNYLNPGLIKRALVDKDVFLEQFHKNPEKSLRRYEQFMQAVQARQHDKDFYPPASAPFWGDEAFVAECHKLMRRHGQEEGSHREPIALEGLAKTISPGISPELLRSPGRFRPITAARSKLVLRALEAGHKPAAIAAFLRLSPSAVSKMVARALAPQCA